MHITTSLLTVVGTVLLNIILLAEMPSSALAQTSNEPIFELPVQLVGFPVIILAVRLSNFVKKLTYSLNPQTYRGRRSIAAGGPLLLPALPSDVSHAAINIALAEKQILSELGPKACVLEEPCRLHAARSGIRGEEPDWTDILRHYKTQTTGLKQWYLLSVFLGDEIRDASLCKRLAKRLSCDRNAKEVIRD